MGLPAQKYSIETMLGLKVSRKKLTVKEPVAEAYYGSVIGQTALIKRLASISERLGEIEFSKFLAITGLSQAELSESLHTSLKTLQRLIKKETTLKEPHLELLVMIAQVYERGFEVFENEEKFKRWMDRLSPTLGGKSPKDLLKSYTGCQFILEELGRIEHGIAA